MTNILSSSEEALIQQFKEGSLEAFDVLYCRYLPNVYNRVRYVIPAEDVEDVTQEVFLAALKSLPAFRGEAQFSTWLRTLTNHKVAEFYRKRNRKQEIQQVPLSEAAGCMEGHTSKALEERIVILHAIEQLPASYQEVLILRFAEDLQFNQIAEVTGRSLDAIKSLFRRAVAALKNQLDES
ncbi:MAG: sigma-70 family RNA polymerase sigma factor [Anaerolineales bacterium]|nr:sigma-70 family RNA polymerase sigma factor [Anaerolineales bacterium]